MNRVFSLRHCDHAKFSKPAIPEKRINEEKLARYYVNMQPLRALRYACGVNSVSFVGTETNIKIIIENHFTLGATRQTPDDHKSDEEMLVWAAVDMYGYDKLVKRIVAMIQFED